MQTLLLKTEYSR